MILIVAACKNGGDKPPVASQDEYQPTILIKKQGELMYKSDSESEYNLASDNMELYPSYWLLQKQGGPSKIRCAKESPKSQDIYKLVSEGEHSFANLGCPLLIARTQSSSFGLRGGENLALPFIISPRSTAVFNSRPKLRWNRVSGVTRYSVSIEDQRGGKGKVWTTEVSDSGMEYPNQLPGDSPVKYIEVDYPADAPSLEPGVDYLAIVTTQQQVEVTDKCRSGWEKQPENPFLCITSSTKDEGNTNSL